MGWEMALTEINDRTAFTQEIAYILRNPLKANINTPWNYRWSSIMAYFQTDKGRGQAISDISKRILWQLLKSRVSLPDNYRIENGLITLDSFINSSAVEKRFMESPIEYYRMITKWSLESIVEERNGKEIVDSYSDADILDYLKSAYGVTNPQGLESKRMMRYIRDIRNRFGASRKQLIRLFAIDEVLLDKLL